MKKRDEMNSKAEVKSRYAPLDQDASISLDENNRRLNPATLYLATIMSSGIWVLIFFFLGQKMLALGVVALTICALLLFSLSGLLSAKRIKSDN